MLVADLQGDNVLLVQEDYNIERYNKSFDQDYSYYFIEDYSKLYGSYGVNIRNQAYYVGEL